MIRFTENIMTEYYAYYRNSDGSEPYFSCFDTEDYDLQIWCCNYNNGTIWVPTKEEDEEWDVWSTAKDVCQEPYDDDYEIWMCSKSEFLQTKPETGFWAWTRDKCESEAFTIIDKSSVNDDDDNGQSAIAFGAMDLDSLIIGAAAGILLMVIIMVCCILSKRRRKRLAEADEVEMSTKELNKMDTVDIRSASVYHRMDSE